MKNRVKGISLKSLTNESALIARVKTFLPWEWGMD
jgi:hypothetical protein